MTIFLLGYMGCGKTLIGSLLSDVLNCGYLDLDSYIEEQEQMKIANLFEEKGELYFRKIEKNYLEEILQNNTKQVLSLGGGTPCYFDTMQRLITNTSVKTIYLQASVSSLSERLFKEKSKRPLISHLQSEEALIEFIAKHIFERSVFYNQSEVIIDANQKPKNIVNDIVLQLF